MAFKELDKRSVSKVENSILESWGGINNITSKQIENRKDSENFVFYDGPATANGMPGVHHILSKLLKDTFCKYKTMKGYKVLRKVGWDTHGLPVEVQVEKELGFSGKLDIEKYGINNNMISYSNEGLIKDEESFFDGKEVSLNEPGVYRYYIIRYYFHILEQDENTMKLQFAYKYYTECTIIVK